MQSILLVIHVAFLWIVFLPFLYFLNKPARTPHIGLSSCDKPWIYEGAWIILFIVFFVPFLICSFSDMSLVSDYCQALICCFHAASISISRPFSWVVTMHWTHHFLPTMTIITVMPQFMNVKCTEFHLPYYCPVIQICKVILLVLPVTSHPFYIQSFCTISKLSHITRSTFFLIFLWINMFKDTRIPAELPLCLLTVQELTL